MIGHLANANSASHPPFRRGKIDKKNPPNYNPDMYVSSAKAEQIAASYLINGCDARAALIECGYSAQYASQARAQAKVMSHPAVRSALARLRAIALSRATYSISVAVDELEQARLLAMRSGQASAAVAAVLAKARLLGLDNPAARPTDPSGALPHLADSERQTLAEMAAEFNRRLALSGSGSGSGQPGQAGQGTPLAAALTPRGEGTGGGGFAAESHPRLTDVEFEDTGGTTS